ncbi:MAG TPA: hypothetical protein ENK02_02180 [Planctomycetes bacterium]|nr:hypothetical protein [Planctomycetota bacterium]
MRKWSLTVFSGASLLLGSVLPSQGQPIGPMPSDGTATTASRALEVHGLPGAIKGTERWIVHFKSRNFDLREFRKAVQSNDAAKVSAVVRDLEAKVKADQAAFEKAVEAMGGEMVAQWWLINGCAIDIPPSKLAELRKMDNVEFIEPDRETNPQIKTATNARNHNADALQARGIRGLGVTTAIMDTGQDEKMGSTNRPHITYYTDGNLTKPSRLIANKKIGAMPADDVHGHGTGVASIAAGAKWRTSTADHGHAYGAKIAGYSIANNTRGSSSYTTMTTAWQTIAADKVRLGIVTANNSYSGSPSPLNSVQKALDAAVLNADILVCTAAGNSGSSTRVSQVNLNGLSVGAVNENVKTLASFSSRGPFTGDRQVFPDIVANGVSTNMARRNLETSDYVASGTSMASPQVCGAATVIRAANKSMKADETKAVLLASVEALAGRTGVNQVNGYGTGYLRDDIAYATATSANNHGRGTLTKASPVFKRVIIVQKGRTYQVAIAWNRLNVNSTTYSNLNLRVLQGTTVLGSSSTPKNTEEFVRFAAPATGPVIIEVRAASLAATSQPFGWAYAQVNAKIPGSYTVFGIGCKGTGTGPKFCASLNPNATGNTTTSWAQNRWFVHQVKANSNLVVTGFDFLCRSLRSAQNVQSVLFLAASNGKPAASPARTGILKVGTTSKFYRTTFSTPITIAAGKVFYIGYKTPANYNFKPEAGAGATLKGTYYWNGPNWSGPWSHRKFAWKVNCAGGSSGAIPFLSNTGVPTLGQTFKVNLTSARKNTAAVLIFGTSKTKWIGLNLPLDLTFLGAKGCFLRASMDLFLVGTAVGSSGSSSITVGIPNLTSLMGVQFHNQYFVVDPPANSFGLVFTNGGTGKIGN